MNNVYVIFEDVDVCQYSGEDRIVLYIAASKQTAVAIANDYIREAHIPDWEDRSYKDFEDGVRIDDCISYCINKFPLYDQVPNE